MINTEIRNTVFLEQFTLSPGAKLTKVKFGDDIADGTQLLALELRYNITISDGLSSSFQFFSEAEFIAFLDSLAGIGGIVFQSATVGDLITSSCSLSDLVLMEYESGRDPLRGWPFETLGEPVQLSVPGSYTADLSVVIDYEFAERESMRYQYAPFIDQLRKGGIDLTVGDLSVVIGGQTWVISGTVEVYAHTRQTKQAKITPMIRTVESLTPATSTVVYSGPSMVFYTGILDHTPQELISAGAHNTTRRIDGMDLVPDDLRFRPQDQRAQLIESFSRSQILLRRRVTQLNDGYRPAFDARGIPLFWTSETARVDQILTVQKAATIDLSAAGWASLLGTNVRIAKMYAKPYFTIKNAGACGCASDETKTTALLPKGVSREFLFDKAPGMLPFLPRVNILGVM